MIRRLNYTGRQRIHHDDVRVTVVERKDASPFFQVEMDLSHYGLPPEAKVYVEAYRQTFWMRFDFGTIRNRITPQRMELTEFDAPEGILFRVRVTSADTAEAKLLAEADQIRSNRAELKEEPREPLLFVKPDALGAQVWRLDFSDRPLLLINRELWDWRAVSRTPAFLSLVYPAVLRELLHTIVVDERYLDADDPDDWRSQWLRFVTLMSGAPQLPDDVSNVEMRKEWIEETVGTFCRQQKMLDQFVKFWRSEGSR